MNKYLLILFIGLAFWGFEEEQKTTRPVDKWWKDYKYSKNLFLGSDSLGGEIPPELGNLTNLIYLNVANNQLSGSIPQEINNIANLSYLRLGNNQLTGELPESICDLISPTHKETRGSEI